MTSAVTRDQVIERAVAGGAERANAERWMDIVIPSWGRTPQQLVDVGLGQHAIEVIEASEAGVYA